MIVALQHLRGLAELWNEVQPRTSLRNSAERLLRIHPLRAADSLQLAAAVIVAGDDRASADFVCLDRRLMTAARREGLTVTA